MKAIGADTPFNSDTFVEHLPTYCVSASQISGLRVHYFKSHWNQFDFVILVFSMVDVGFDFTTVMSTHERKKGGSTVFSPSVLRIVKTFRLLRLLRSLRLVKVNTVYVLTCIVQISCQVERIALHVLTYLNACLKLSFCLSIYMTIT